MFGTKCICYFSAVNHSNTILISLMGRLAIIPQLSGHLGGQCLSRFPDKGAIILLVIEANPIVFGVEPFSDLQFRPVIVSGQSIGLFWLLADADHLSINYD